VKIGVTFYPVSFFTLTNRGINIIFSSLHTQQEWNDAENSLYYTQSLNLDKGGCNTPQLHNKEQNHPDVSFLDFRREIVLFYLQGSRPIPSRPGPSHNRSEIRPIVRIS